MAEPLAPEDPVQVGRYRLLGRLGEGGMGQVFLGTTAGGRQVAVKIIAPAYARDPEFRARFAREVAAARLVGGFHTAQVVDADTGAAAPWMASAYIPGPSLRAAVADGGPMSPEAVFGLGAALAEGLEAIHSCGLVHRDLKPGNIILASDGPRIIDFGIVRAADTHTRLTETGTVVGTASFMSPEQVSGDPVGPPSDVFSLGCVLAYAATGHGPFDAPDITVSMYRVRFEQPNLGTAGGPLRAVLADCLVKDPAGRPALGDLVHRLAASAAAAADQAASTREPEADARDGPRSKAAYTPTLEAPRPAPPPSREAPQRPAPAPAAPPGAKEGEGEGRPGQRPAGQPRAAGQRPDASGGNRIALEKTDVPVRRVAFSPDGRLLAGAARPVGQTWPSHICLWDLTTGRLAGAPITEPPGDASDLWYRSSRDSDEDIEDKDLQFSPDGRFLAYGSFTKHSVYGNARIWDLSSRRVVTLEQRSPEHFLNACAFSPDGTLFAATGSDKHSYLGKAEDCQASLWNLSTGRLVDPPANLTRRSASVPGIAFTPDGKLLVIYSSGGVLVRKTTAGSTVHPYIRKRMSDAVGLRALVSADSRWLAVYSSKVFGNRLSLWDLTRHQVAGHFDLKGLDEPVAFSPAGPLLAARNANEEELAFLNTTTGQPAAPRQPIAADGLQSILFSPDGRLIATQQRGPSAGADSSPQDPLSQRNHTWTFRLLQVTTGQPAADYLRFTAELRYDAREEEVSMLFSPDGRHFAVRPGRKIRPDGGADGVHWWDLAGRTNRAARQLVTGQASGMAFSPGSRLLAAAADGEAMLWGLS